MNSGEALLGEMAANPDNSVEDLNDGDLKAIREFLDSDLYSFAIYICGFKDLIPSLHGHLADWIKSWGMVQTIDGTWTYYTQVHPSEPLLQDQRRIMTQIPREHFKTSLGTIANALWQVSRTDPDGVPGIYRPVALFNERQDNATKWLRSIRDIIQSSRVYQRVYPDRIPPGIARGDSRTLPRYWKWNDAEIDLAGKRTGEVEASISAHGVESATTGGHWPKMILDDLISVKHQQSQVEMERARAWLTNHVYLMRPAEGSLAYVNCTPWTYTDIYVDCCRDYKYKLYRRSALEGLDGKPDVASGQPIFPQKLSREKLVEMHKRNAFSFNCTPADAEITMADFSQRPISQVNVGDKVMGFAVSANNGCVSLIPSVVTGIASKYAKVNTYQLADGSKVRCTEDHRWYGYNQRRAGGVRYVEASKIGALRRVIPATEDLTDYQRLQAGWLGGFFDGDGCLQGVGSNGSRGSISFKQSEHRYPEICRRFREAMTSLGFEWSEFICKEGYTTFQLLGGVAARIRFYRLCRPSKVGLYESLLTSKGKKHKVLSVEIGVEEPVYALETETGNYISQGFQSANSQMQCVPVPGEHQSFSQQWMKFGGLTTDLNGEPAFRIEDAHYDRTARNIAGTEDPAPQLVPLHWMNKALILDPAPTEKTESKSDPHARSAILVEGIDSWGRRYILESWADRLGYEAIISKIFELSIKWGAPRIWIEEVNFSNVYRHWIQREQRRDGKFPGQFLQPMVLKPNKREKHARILAREPAWREGLYYLNREGTLPFQVEFVEYPNSQTIDLLDCMGYDTDALARPESSDELAKRRKLERSGGPYSDPYFTQPREGY